MSDFSEASAVEAMAQRKQAIYALAASWASIDGKLEAFGKERFARSREEAPTGHHEGYLIEAEEMLDRMEKRGFTLTRLTAPAQADMHATPKLDRALRYVESKLRHYDARPWTGSQEELQNLRDILADLKASPTPPPTEADWVPLAKALFATEGSPNVLGQAWFDFQGKAQRILAAMASAKPTPPRVDEKEMREMFRQELEKAGFGTLWQQYVIEESLRRITNAVIALMEKCK